MTICQASFDLTSRKFRIPFPHLTFNEATAMEPMRLGMIEDYLHALEVPESEKVGKVAGDWQQSQRQERAREKAALDAVDWQQGGLISLEDAKRCREQAHIHFRNSYEDQVSAPPADSFGYRGCGSHHNLIMGLVARLQKYHERGIHIHGVKLSTLDHAIEFHSER
jgi:hypothetical protein